MSAPALVGLQSKLGVAAAERVRVLPVHPELERLFPWDGLRRGSTVAVRGSTSLLLALLGEPTAAGSWAAVVGMPNLGVAAAAELGVAVERLALVPSPAGQLSAVVAALLDGIDVVVVATGETGARLTDAQARRLSARARHRGAVLIPFGPWPGADLELSCEPGAWTGPGIGNGHLTHRPVTVHTRGRGAAARPISADLLLPAPDGSVQPTNSEARPRTEPREHRFHLLASY